MITSYAASAAKTQVKVVTSNHALALLVAAVAPTGLQIRSLLPAVSDPHHVNLTPSQLQDLTGAHLVVWQGPQLDVSFTSAIARLPAAAVVELRDDASSLTYGHDWLSPGWSGQMAGVLAARLVELVPGQAAEINARYARFSADLAALAEHADQQLRLVPAPQFLALHDAYRPLQQHFGLLGLGFIYDSQGASPGARQLWQLEQLLQSRSSTCLFTQPQFPLRFVAALDQSNKLVMRELDPMASQWTLTPTAFLEYYQRLLETMLECLQAASSAGL